MTEPEALLSEKEVAQMLQVSVYTLARLRKKGKSPPYKMVGNKVRYRREAVEAWIRGNESASA